MGGGAVVAADAVQQQVHGGQTGGAVDEFATVDEAFAQMLLLGGGEARGVL